MRYTIRRLLYFIAIVAITLAIYRSILFDVKRCNMVVGIFGPSFEHKGVVYDREVLHSQVKSSLPDMEYQSIPKPAWAEGIEISGSNGSTPARSDWFVIERAGVRNYLHLTSAHDGLAIDVWINEGVMYHQRKKNPDQVLPRELTLSNELVSVLHAEWNQWCNAHREDRITKR
ncbi:hypothetical protein Poly51_26510 [Rubripirellula tenax]|uniref:Uncharacterized protein n=1 Tax=Rubripirellula tenax TaxID=2528015 RepID=A0A5C6F8B3_9BACT|nr:hypothetical protein [Rubripirellula tenax]TWU56734.1 hypothetical protein Poly51_26510 [Rubripirellula tenax]